MTKPACRSTKRKGWVGRTASEFVVGVTRTTASDSSGDEKDFGNSWKRSDRTNRQLNEETVPSYQKWDISNFSERLSLFGSLSERETETGRNRTRSLSDVYVNFC